MAVLTGLERWEKNTQGRHSFPDARLAGYVTDLATPHIAITSSRESDRRLAQLLLGTRLASHSGGAIACVTTRPSAD
ncbi:hypothetical protein ACH5A2_40400 [Streptomyces collinus]|uniref:hypothetical protein n=1 Tax=Streptomyces collinus TaxID=42684 RepID=UPI0037B7D127